jgi:hypothetical protein
MPRALQSPHAYQVRLLPRRRVNGDDYPMTHEQIAQTALAGGRRLWQHAI